MAGGSILLCEAAPLGCLKVVVGIAGAVAVLVMAVNVMRAAPVEPDNCERHASHAANAAQGG